MFNFEYDLLLEDWQSMAKDNTKLSTKTKIGVPLHVLIPVVLVGVVSLFFSVLHNLLFKPTVV